LGNSNDTSRGLQKTSFISKWNWHKAKNFGEKSEIKCYFQDITKITQLAEPYTPVIDGQILTDYPHNLISQGEIRPYTPVVFGIQRDEGESFMNLLNFIVKKVLYYMIFL